ncbi:MAG: DUF4112 domain-containing protein [Pseudorhodoplanes sp.]
MDSRREPFPKLDPEQLRRLRRARGIARLMDTAVRIPGTGIRFGADSVMGLIPGVGDAAGAIIGLVIVNEARRLGLPPEKLVRMLVNIGFDAVAGSIPIAGDLFDIYFKSHRRNVTLMMDHFGIDDDRLR